ncbi:hypothetical protein D1872_277710 [compost metagenome]
MPRDVFGQVPFGGSPRHDQTGGGRNQQSGNLADQAVTDRQDRISGERFIKRHAMNRHPDNETADQVDQQNNDTGDRIALDEFTRPVHSAVEVGFAFDFGPPFAGLLLIDQPRVQVGIDTHLFPRHRVEGEPRRYLGHALRTLRDDDKLNDHKNQKHDKTDDGLPLGNP